MNNRELKAASKFYDLLEIRNRLEILDKVEDVYFEIYENGQLDAVNNYLEGRVTIRYKKDDVSDITSTLRVEHHDGQPADDELDTIEGRLAHKAVNHLLTSGLFT